MNALLTKGKLEWLLTEGNLRPGEPVYDTQLKGFVVVLRPDRQAVFFVQVPGTAGGRKRISLGVCGEVTLDEARAKAAELLASQVSRRRRVRPAPPAGASMEIVPISPEEFAELTKGDGLRAPCGQNRSLLKRAETEPVKLVFETERQAINRLTALYVVRRRTNAQVKILRQGTVIALGPGQYVPSMRKQRGKG